MGDPYVSPITELTLVEGGAMVTFKDGLCAIYPAAVLHACLSLAKIVSERTCEEAKSDSANYPEIKGAPHSSRRPS